MLKSFAVALLLVLLGAAVSYFGLYEPYMQMSRGESGVSYSDKMQFFGPFITVAGAVFLIGTPLAPGGVMQPWAQQTGRGKAVLILALLAGAAAGIYVAFVWFPEQAAQFGYIRR